MIEPYLTADLPTLERLEAETRDNPGRELYERALKAQIEHTRKYGRDSLAWEKSGKSDSGSDEDIPW